MKHVPTVAWRELRSLFVSPVAYGVMSLFAVLTGLFFILYVSAFVEWVARLTQFQEIERLAQTNVNDDLVAPFYQMLDTVLLILVPGITMGLFTAEKQNGTQELLLTSPLTMWDVVLGKFVAGAAFVAVLVGMVSVYPGLLFLYGGAEGGPELGKTLSGHLGVLLVGWTYVAIGTFASALTRSQVVSFLMAFVLLLFLQLLPAISDLGVLGGGSVLGEVLRWVATGVHFQPMLRGLVDTQDLVYFAVIIGSFLLLTKASVESVRWR
jgi:ABC-2 type transport system permease protein